MRRLVALLVFVFVATLGFADDPQRWKEFTSKEGRFKVLMLGTPKRDQAETESDFGKGTLHMNVVVVANTMYGANYCDFPAKVNTVPLKQVFDSSRDGAVGNLQGMLANEKDIKLGEHPGREFQIEVAGGRLWFRARVYLVDQRLYQVVVFGTKESATAKDAERFLGSFQIGGRVEEVERLLNATDVTTPLGLRDRALLSWLDELAPSVVPKTEIATAVGYALNQWEAFVRYCDAGWLLIDNTRSERALRPIAIGRSTIKELHD